MLREWNGKAITLVDTWNILYRDARIVSLFGHVVSSNAVLSAQSVPFVTEDIIGSIMLLSQDSKDPIKILINNVGGNVNDGFAIIQAMEHAKAKGIEVWTVNICQSSSMATIILLMGTKGKRFVFNNTITHLHSGNKSISGKPEDVENLQRFSNEHFLKTLGRMLMENTSIPEYWNNRESDEDARYTLEQLKKTSVRAKLLDDFMNGERFLLSREAIEAGVADKVLMPGDPIIDAIYSSAKNQGRE